MTKSYILGIGLTALGGFLNFTVIIANGGKMPVMANGKVAKDNRRCPRTWPESSRHTLMTESTRFKALGDRFDLSNGIYSIGDLLMFGGLAFSALSLLIPDKEEKHQSV